MRLLRSLLVGLSLAAGLAGRPADAQTPGAGGGWSGPYWGVTAGGEFADARHAKRASDLAWSGHVGYGLQISALYVGAEADVAWGGATTGFYLSPLYNSTLTLDWTATARARVGIAVGGALLYATGGLAWSEQTVGTYQLGSPLASTSRQIPGAVLGVGLEMKLLPYVSARIEALRYDFSDQAREFRGLMPATLPATNWNALNVDETVVRAGLSIRFN